jgi:hypothetical protein
MAASTSGWVAKFRRATMAFENLSREGRKAERGKEIDGHRAKGRVSGGGGEIG